MKARSRRGLVPVVLVVAAIGAAPHVAAPYVIYELTFVGAYAIAVLSLVILTGRNGQISLGHGAFMGLGGYTVAVLAQRADVPYALGLPIAVLLCGALGVALGFVAARLAGVYLGLATFALGFSLTPLLKRFKDVTGGVVGLPLAPVGVPGSLRGLVSPDDWLYYVTWSIVAVVFGFTAMVLRGRIGRALQSLRDSEVAAVSCGINPLLYRTLAFGWTAAYAGIAGALCAMATAYLSLEAVGSELSVALLIGAVLGGIESMWGALIGGIIIVFLPLWTQRINSGAPSVVFGVALIVVMIFFPSGLVGGIRRLVRQLVPPKPQIEHTQTARAGRMSLAAARGHQTNEGGCSDANQS